MPFPPQPPTSGPATADARNTPAAETEIPADHGGGDDSWQQEKQVRLTAQRILADHLRQPDGSQQEAGQPAAHLWDQVDLNLTGATLIDFSLANSKVTGDAGFDGATFTGNAGFDGTTFTGQAEFDRATFTGDARFGGATFSLGPDAFDFSNTHVRSADSGHVWPAGWQLDVDGQGQHKVGRTAGT